MMELALCHRFILMNFPDEVALLNGHVGSSGEG